MQRFCILQCACVDSRPCKAFATSGLQKLTINNGDAKSSELMVKAFLEFSFKQPLFSCAVEHFIRTFGARKILAGARWRKRFVKDVLRKHGA